MNLFVLDRDPLISAKMNCDKHVNKIILEAVQMMSLAHITNNRLYANINGAQVELWNAKTHKNNHVSLWVRETTSNYEWTAKHGLALCDEYNDRYGKIHNCQPLMNWLATNQPPLNIGGLTPFRQAVADDCYHQDPVVAYHLYYVRYKSRFAKWRTGKVPNWYIQLMLIEHGIIVDTTPSKAYIKMVTHEHKTS